VLKQILEEMNCPNLSECVIDKMITWAIKNIGIVQKAYIEDQRTHGNKVLIKAIEFEYLRDSEIKGYVFVKVKYSKGKEYLCLIDDKTTITTSEDVSEIENDVKNGMNVMLSVSELIKLKNNGIIPMLITKVVINGEKV